MCRGVLPSCVSTHHGHTVPVEARRRDGIISELELELTAACGCWECSPGPLEEPPVLSTTELHLSPSADL